MIPQRRSSGPGGVFHDLPYPFAQIPELLVIEIGGRTVGMDPGFMQRFIGVDVSDPRDHPLIEQNGLCRSLGPAEGIGDLFRTNGGSLGAEAGQETAVEVFGGCREMDPAEPTRIHEPDSHRLGVRVGKSPAHVTMRGD